MEIGRTDHGDIRALTPGGTRIDAANALAFKEAMRAAVAGHDGRVVVDMARIEFLDSSGLGALVATLKMLGRGRVLELARCGPIVLKVLRLTRMDSVFTVHDALPWAPGQDAA
jgi:anti-sigma B factor antagonist